MREHSHLNSASRLGCTRSAATVICLLFLSFSLIQVHASRAVTNLDNEIRDYTEFAALIGTRTRDGLLRCGDAVIRFQATGRADEARKYQAQYAQVIAALSDAESLASRRHPEHTGRFSRLRRSIENWDAAVRGEKLTSSLPQRDTAVLFLRQANLFQSAHAAIVETESELRSRIDQRHG
jgi:hypothetical protein